MKAFFSLSIFTFMLTLFSNCSTNEILFKKGLEQLNKNDYVKADSLFEESFKINKSLKVARYYAMTQMFIGDTCNAINILNSCSKKEANEFYNKYFKPDTLYYTDKLKTSFGEYSVIYYNICSGFYYQYFYLKSNSTNKINKYKLVDSQGNEMIIRNGKEDKINDYERLFCNVDQLPEFPGGNDSLTSFISNNIQYPSASRMLKIQGRVIVEFVVNSDGKVENVKLLNGVEESLNNEAIRVIKSLPNWNPGIVDNMPVSVAFAVPINFKLN